MADPPKRTEKLQVMIDDDELRVIDDWRFDHRLLSRGAAIRELIKRGLNATEFDPPETDSPSGDFRVTDEP